MDLTLTAETRSAPGSRAAGRLRAEGKVPGVVYGLGGEPVPVVVKWAELRRVLTTEAGLNALITLDYDGNKDFTIVKDMQRDPVRRDVLHVDFLRVDRNVLVEVEVPLVVVGEAKQVESAKGLAEQQMKSLTVKAKPDSIPGHLEVDISSLEVGTAITVADLVLPEGTTTEVDPAAPVVVGIATRFTAAEGAPAEEGEGGEGAGETEGESGSGDTAE